MNHRSKYQILTHTSSKQRFLVSMKKSLKDRDFHTHSFADNPISQSIIPKHRAHFLTHPPNPKRNGNLFFIETTPNSFVMS